MRDNQLDYSNNYPKGIKKNKFWGYILSHKLTISLIIIILVVFSWAKIKMYAMDEHFIKEKSELTTIYKSIIDSINITGMETTTKVFSWAIRSEMTRENIEQVNQFFLEFIKEPNIKKIQLINPHDSMIMISTDKKDEFTITSDSKILKTNSQNVYEYEFNYLIYTPIMGLNKKIGILAIEVTKFKN
ncbi:MAG: hypothetical protein A2033_05910 [Bacteroidetes bacterium GWA2_31_9]|nr:MAG: hypothetical protein A2033_05910 [Bacteroidetes bacterium GWA2_31_9]